MQTRGAEFVDTNVVLYLLSSDAGKARAAERLLHKKPLISVQVLNEVANVCTRKLAMSAEETRHIHFALEQSCTVLSLSPEHCILALSVMARHRLSYFDSLIVGTALIAGCTTLYSEDLQHGMKIAHQLTVKNPFV